MALYAIADLHLPLGIDKPMDIFGRKWHNYVDRLHDNWQRIIKEDDCVVIPGDFSWATYLEEATKDFEFLHNLNGKKLLLKGNHVYWWTTKAKLDRFVSEKGFFDIEFIHNNSYIYENTAICGTRGWIHPNWENFGSDDKKIYEREVTRLELSLKSVANCDEVFVFTHYPPISAQQENNAFRQIMKKYNVAACYYGHLHAAAQHSAFCGEADGIRYRLVAADYLDFVPLRIK